MFDYIVKTSGKNGKINHYMVDVGLLQPEDKSPEEAGEYFQDEYLDTIAKFEDKDIFSGQ